MHEQRVALRVVDGYGTIRTQRKTGILVVLAIVTCKFILVYRIHIHHVAEGLAKALFAIVVNTISHHHLTLVRENRAVHQTSTVVLGIIIALLGIDMALSRGDIRRTNNMSQRQTGVVIKSIGSEEELGTLHLHIVIEYRHFALGVIFSPVGGKRSLTVNHLSTLKEVGIIIQTVVIKAIGIKSGLLMLQHHIITGTSHLLVTIVISIIAQQRERIALVHLHMSERLERIAGLIEIGTIAIQSGTLMCKMYLTIQNGGIGILQLVVMQHIGMHQIHTCILSLSRFTCSRTTTLLLLLGKCRNEANHQND